MDIKPQNFIFVNGLLKVIDLGCAELVDEGEEFMLCESSKGTDGYMAPECFVMNSDRLFKFSIR